ncbi:MAG TPA: 4-hydroxythreonine-4-phosphate dehydrogenase PdxA [Vulgatibacter sp.]
MKATTVSARPTVKPRTKAKVFAAQGQARPRARARAAAIAISMGDPSGIGAEVTAAALASRGMKGTLTPYVYGDEAAWVRACLQLGIVDRLPRVDLGDPLPARGGALVRVSRLAAGDRRPGKPTREGALAQVAYIDSAIEAVRSGEAAALCTAPITKAALHEAGLPYPGHTELLADRFGVERVAMMLAGPVLRVVVATTHVALKDVSGLLSAGEIEQTLSITDRALRTQFGIRRPRIAVCGLNPHAGEGGLFGDEEERIIAPAVERARAAGIRAEGPFPADGLFPRAARGGWDAVVAMYHDQGLIPLKTVHLETAVNVTLGLPVPRTSPDHGVAYDIAGKGRADPTSMIEALRLAARLAGA